MVAAHRSLQTRCAQPVTVNLSDVHPQQVQWLWPGRIALGKITLLVGEPGEGKSFLSLDLAARVSTGAKWPDDCGHAPRGGVVLLNAEDDIADTVRPRLDAAAADVSNIVALQAVEIPVGKGKTASRQFDLASDLESLEKAVIATPDCRLVIVDPISAYTGELDSHNNSVVRSMLAPLGELAAKHNVAVLVVSHFRKSDGRAKHRVTGSMAFVAAARAAWALAADKLDPEHRRKLLVCIKNNLGPDQSGLAFRLGSRNGGLPWIEWCAGRVDISADEALEDRQQPGPKPGDREIAEAFLREILKDGPRASAEIEDEAKHMHGISRRTLMRARERIGVNAFREDGRWYQRLPDDDTDPDVIPMTATA